LSTRIDSVRPATRNVNGQASEEPWARQSECHRSAPTGGARSSAGASQDRPAGL